MSELIRAVHCSADPMRIAKKQESRKLGDLGSLSPELSGKMLKVLF
jgi:hypothetical protein